MLKKIIREFLNFLIAHRKKILILAASFVLGFILLSSVFLYVDIKGIGKVIFAFNIWKFLLYLSIPFFTLCLQTLRWSTILKSYGFRVDFWQLLQYIFAGFGFSYLTPIAELGGGPFKAYLLKKQRIKFRDGFVTVCIDDFIGIFMEALLAAIGILYLIIYIGLAKDFIWLIGIACALFISLLIIAYLRLRHGKPIFSPLLNLVGARYFKKIRKIQKKVADFETLFIAFFLEKKSALKRAFILTIIMNIMGIGEVGFLLYLMGAFHGWANVFFARMVINASNLFPVPAGLGVSEWGSAGLFEASQSGREIGLVFSLLFKARSLFFSFLGLGIFSYYWMRNLVISQKITKFVKEKINGQIF